MFSPKSFFLKRILLLFRYSITGHKIVNKSDELMIDAKIKKE
jgi:hypothetical protein